MHFFDLPQTLMFCDGLSVSLCPGQHLGCWWPWSEKSPVELSITGDQRCAWLERTPWRGVTGPLQVHEVTTVSASVLMR